MTEEEFERKKDEARKAVARYRREHNLPANYTSGDADTGSLSEDEEEELRRRHG